MVLSFAYTVLNHNRIAWDIWEFLSPSSGSANLGFVFAVCHGSYLPFCGGCFPADKLLQLQLLVFCWVIHCRADLPSLEGAGQTQTTEGAEPCLHFNINMPKFMVCH